MFLVFTTLLSSFSLEKFLKSHFYPFFFIIVRICNSKFQFPAFRCTTSVFHDKQFCQKSDRSFTVFKLFAFKVLIEIHPKPVVGPGFSRGGANSQSGCTNLLLCNFFAKNCTKMKEFVPRGRRIPSAPFDPPL